MRGNMKNKKQKYIDDGHTIYDMNVDAPWNTRRKKQDDTTYVSKDERKLLTKAAYRAYLPKLLIVLAGFGLAIFLIYLWLK